MSSAPLRLLLLNGASPRSPDIPSLLASAKDASGIQLITRDIESLRVIGSATFGEERRQSAVDAALNIDVVVIVLDDELLRLNEGSLTAGIEILAEVGVPIVLMLGFGDETESDFLDAAAWMQKHVRATLSLDANAAELLAAVRAADAGLVVLEQRIADAMSKGVTRSRQRNVTNAKTRSAGEAPLLSTREREVLALLAQGHATKNIAHLLGISSHTVKAHVESIFAKFGATTRAEAVAIGVRRGAVML